MAAIPQITDNFAIVERIYKAIQQNESKPFRLSRIGSSGIGKECLREVWYSWRGYSNEVFDGRMQRLFKTGHLQEDRIVADLKLAGYNVWEKDPTTDEQWTYSDDTGHFVVKLDGVIKGIEGAEKTPHVLEIKTHNKKSFGAVQKSGVEKSKPEHYDQMHCGMMFSGLHRAFYVALCKDDERFHVERIVFDQQHANRLQHKLSVLVRATIPPTPISDKPDSFECKWCKHRKVCKGGELPIRTCRSCEYAEAIHGGAWVCTLLKNVLTQEDQLKACEHYSLIGK